MEDRRVGLVIRALRRRRSWRQVDLARAAGMSQSEISRAELGHLDSLSLRALRRVLAALDARLYAVVRWRGGDIDRLVDEQHARIAAVVAAELRASGWTVLSEVTFARLGERGSFDLLAGRPEERIAAMFEIKTEVTSAEETQRRFDAKRRVVASVVEERFGWRPRAVGSFLVLADSSPNRRRMQLLGDLLGAPGALGTRESRSWLKAPAGAVFGVWFVRLAHGWGTKRGQGGSHRVRVRRDGVSRAGHPPDG